MKIFETRTAPNPRRVRMFLAEKGLLDKVEFLEVDLLKGGNLTPEFQAMNPMKKVPVMQLDDGSCIAETMAICLYFEQMFPETTPLMGTTPLEKAQLDQWQRWLDYYFFLPTGMCFQHSTGYFKDRMTPIPEWGEEAGRQTVEFFSFLDRHLEGRTFIYGDTITAADITALCVLDFARVVKIRIQPEQKNLQAWYDHMSARPSAKA